MTSYRCRTSNRLQQATKLALAVNLALCSPLLMAQQTDRSADKTEVITITGSRIARTIIALGRELDLTILAEGVENETVGRLVTALGCAEAQGYHYGRPMSEEQFLEWLQVHQKGIA